MLLRQRRDTALSLGKDSVNLLIQREEGGRKRRRGVSVRLDSA